MSSYHRRMQEAFVSPPPDGPGAAAVVAVERALEPLAVTVHRPEAAAWGLRLSCAGWPLDLGIALRRGVLLSQAEVLGPGKLSPGGCCTATAAICASSATRPPRRVPSGSTASSTSAPSPSRPSTSCSAGWSSPPRMPGRRPRATTGSGEPASDEPNPTASDLLMRICVPYERKSASAPSRASLRRRAAALSRERRTDRPPPAGPPRPRRRSA